MWSRFKCWVDLNLKKKGINGIVYFFFIIWVLIIINGIKYESGLDKKGVDGFDY